jgi:hypothetical protein
VVEEVLGGGVDVEGVTIGVGVGIDVNVGVGDAFSEQPMVQIVTAITSQTAKAIAGFLMLYLLACSYFLRYSNAKGILVQEIKDSK